MTKDDIHMFIRLVTNTPMVVYPCNADAVINFVTGYEYGTKGNCNFSQLSKELLSKKYKIKYSSDGWCGQIGRLAKKRDHSWVFTFKQITLEIIAIDCNGILPDYDRELFINRVSTLIDQIDGSLYDEWPERWLDLASAEKYFPNQLWSAAQLKIIKSISKEIKSDNIYDNTATKTPSAKLVELMKRFKTLENRD